MKKIDRETVQRILDAADIVEVVSDFVSLKKHGNSYIGLCPFHNDRRPSFSVNRAKGICKCFSCGKGGSPLNFLMELEQMTYHDALIYLAKKYNIEVKERELTDQEKVEANQREALMAVNEFALGYFENILANTDDGRDIGLAYFRERGINDLMVKKFHLGYSFEKSDDLYNTAISKGFTEQALLDTGLCAKSERGIYDRFRARVIYPVFTVSGRVIAFGGRTLRSDKNIAKYVNSPESSIYHKSNELYGLYQAKSAIVKRDKCILVEGYMDVISMHQVGVENVVASSGTSLTDGQIRLIHRFTNNVTVIYDSDAAGIKASLRGIDMLLAAGLNIKVLLLPEGEDPDSFAQSHSATEVEKYIAENEKDFIRFKTDVLLKDAGDDLTKRSSAINSIIKSISLIPDPVSQALYLQECSRMLNIDEKTLKLRLSKDINDNLDKQQRTQLQQQQLVETQNKEEQPANSINRLDRPEINLTKYIVKYGFMPIALKYDDEDVDESQQLPEFTVLSFIQSELNNDSIDFTNPICRKIYEQALSIMDDAWPKDLKQARHNLNRAREHARIEGMEQIRQSGKDLSDMESREHQLMDSLNEEYESALAEFTMNYLEEFFLSCDDDEVRHLATDLASEKYVLSKVHTKYAHIETEQERLPDLVFRGILELKYAILEQEIANLNQEMKRCGDDMEAAKQLMSQLFDLYQLKSQFARELGERIVNPK